MWNDYPPRERKKTKSWMCSAALDIHFSLSFSPSCKSYNVISDEAIFSHVNFIALRVFSMTISSVQAIFILVYFLFVLSSRSRCGCWCDFHFAQIPNNVAVIRRWTWIRMHSTCNPNEDTINRKVNRFAYGKLFSAFRFFVLLFAHQLMEYRDLWCSSHSIRFKCVALFCAARCVRQ